MSGHRGSSPVSLVWFVIPVVECALEINRLHFHGEGGVWRFPEVGVGMAGTILHCRLIVTEWPLFSAS